MSPVGEESNVPSDEDDDEDSSEEYDGETEEESGKSTGDVDPDEVESKVSDEEEVHDGDEAITPSTPLRCPVSRDDYDTPIADLLGSNRSHLSKRKTKRKKHRKKTGHTGHRKTKKGRGNAVLVVVLMKITKVSSFLFVLLLVSPV